MGVLITVEPSPSTSAYDYWKLYRATAKTGSYSVINGNNGQLLADLSYYDEDGTSTSWYKTSYYNSSTQKESSLSTPLQGYSQTYTTVKKVESIMGLSARSDTTNPSVQQIIEFIARVEDEIDYKTNHAWRTRYSGTRTGKDQTQRYEYSDMAFNYEYQSGRPLYLGHRFVKSFDSAAGDTLEIFDGANWEDWIATKSEGRSNDYWADYDKGIIYIKARYGVVKPLGARVKYRYGEPIVPGIIEDIATKMVAIELARADSRTVNISDGENAYTIRDRIDSWQKNVDDKIPQVTEFKHIKGFL